MAQCCVMLFLERLEQITTHPEWKLTTDQSKDTTRVQLDEGMTFIEVIYKTMGKGLLTEAEMT